MKVKKGDTVKVDYTGSFEGGEVFDTSEGKQPLEFVVGEGRVIKGFDDAVVGMEKGKEKEVSIEPKDAYGEARPEMKKEIPRENLPKDQEPKEGMVLVLQAPTGQQMPAKIIKVTKKGVTIDLNHPLAGKKLNFKLKIVEINSNA